MRRERLKQSARDLFIEIGEVFDVELGDEESASACVQPLARVSRGRRGSGGENAISPP